MKVGIMGETGTFLGPKLQLLVNNNSYCEDEFILGRERRMEVK